MCMIIYYFYAKYSFLLANISYRVRAFPPWWQQSDVSMLDDGMIR